MAELSTLSPSPPALSDSHAAPAIPPSSPTIPSPNSSTPEPTRMIPVPKSSLYNDKALTENTTASLSGGSTLSPPYHAAETPVPLLVGPIREELIRNNTETKACVIKQEIMTVGQPAAKLLTTETLALASEPPATSEIPQASPSPDKLPGPNLYPNVHVTHRPSPVQDEGQPIAAQPETPAGSDTANALSASSTAKEEKPQLLQQAKNPQSEPPPPPPPLSPKPDTFSGPRKGELPTTPTRAEQPSPSLPVIQEPLAALPLPKPRPAPDTLSYLESASLMSGTLESLSGLGEDGSSVGSDSEINGLTVRRTDKYGFLGGNQYSESG